MQPIQRRSVAALALVAGLAACGVAPASADRGDSWLVFQTSVSTPIRDFRQFAAPGLEAALAFTEMSRAHVGPSVEVGYTRWGSTDQTLPFIGPSRLSYQVIRATAHVLYDFRTSGMVRPYAKAGFGLYLVRTSLTTPYGPINSWEPRPGYVGSVGLVLTGDQSVRIGFASTLQIIQDTQDWQRAYTVGLNLNWRL